MVELRWIKMFLFLILGLQFTAVTGQTLYITVRDGDEATLSCGNVMTDQDKCDRTTWFFIGSRNTAVELIKLGQIVEEAKAKSDRLSVTVNCSLVIKKVTVEDAGRYFCRQFDGSGQKQGRDSLVYLSVVSMTEHKDTDEVKLTCSVSTDGGCLRTVQWVYEGNDQDVNIQHMKESPSSCSATVEFNTSHLTETSKYSELFKCRVTNENSGEEQLFTFIRPSSVTEQTSLYITVRDGDEATLSCENVMTDQDKCDSTSWIFSDSRNRAGVALIKLGQIGEKAKAKSDRLSVTADCSLVIKKVTVEDFGRYTCRQKQGQDAQVYLSVVNMTEHKDTDKVKLNCSVSTYGPCTHTVKWVYEGNDQDVNTQHMKESQSSCFEITEKSKYSELFKCRVTDKRSGEVQLFPFNSSSSDEDTKTAATTSSTPTTKPATASTSTKPSTETTMGNSTEAKMNQTPPTTNQTKQQATIIGVAVGLASLLIIVLVLIRLKKSKRNKTQTDENIVDPEEGVSYASISYTKKTNSKARVHGDDDAVTYSTVKASSSSAGASTDPSNLYATVN